MGKALDLTGYTFHGCRVLSRAPNKGRQVRWYCECECGNEFIATRAQIRIGQTQSCGCKENIIRPKLK